jgi:acyl carrier protein
MMRMDMDTDRTARDRLRETLAAVLNVDPGLLDDAASPASIPTWDSLNHLNVVLAVESEFGVSLSVDDALAMRSVAAIRRILKARGVAV